VNCCLQTLWCGNVSKSCIPENFEWKPPAAISTNCFVPWLVSGTWHLYGTQLMLPWYVIRQALVIVHCILKRIRKLFSPVCQIYWYFSHTGLYLRPGAKFSKLIFGRLLFQWKYADFQNLFGKCLRKNVRRLFKDFEKGCTIFETSLKLLRKNLGKYVGKH